MTLTDARGVTIAPGDTAIWGYPYDSSIGMAEGVVLGDVPDFMGDEPEVSLTASGRVRIRVTRRSTGPGTKPVVDIAPDRLVVLKPFYSYLDGEQFTDMHLPPSPLPAQEENRD